MKINSEKLKRLASEAGATAESLGEAVARPGLADEAATKAVRNWMAGRHYPRAKVEDIRRLAGALGLEAKDIARFESRSRWTRSSPRKARLLADMIRGQRVDHAVNLLTFNKRRAAKMVLKTLKAAIADAEQGEADVTELFVSETRVDQGVIIKRFQPKDRGRAHSIQKKTSHITVAVEEAA